MCLLMIYPCSYCTFCQGKPGQSLQWLWAYFFGLMWNNKSISNLPYFPNFCSVIYRQHLCHLKAPCCDGWDIRGQSLYCGFNAFSSTTLFARSWCLHLLGNFLVACICAWCHFLGVRLYSIYNIGRQDFEIVLCLILHHHLVESFSFAILHCQSYLQEWVSRRGLLHYSEGSVFLLR